MRTGRIDCAVTGDDHGAKISAAFLVCADGHAAAPYYILQGTKATQRMDGVGDDSDVGFTDGGNMTDELWSKSSIKHVVKEIRKHVPEGWVLLTMDQYGSHINSCAALEYLYDNKILAYSPHSHSTFFTQPLDQGIIRSTKARYRRLQRDRELTEVDALTKWEIPGLVERAWRECTGGDKGADMVRGAFRVVGLHPFDRDFVESTRHLHGLAVPFDDNLENVAASNPSYEPCDSVELLIMNGDTIEAVAHGRVVLDVVRLHFRDVMDDECVVEVRGVDQSICNRSPVPLLYHDQVEGWGTLEGAWEGTVELGGDAFMTAWKKRLLRRRGAAPSSTPAVSEVDLPLQPPARAPALQKKATVPSFFGLKACRRENVRKIVESQNFSKACKDFMMALRGGGDEGGGLPTELEGETGTELLSHIIEFGGHMAAATHEAFPQLKESKRSKRAAEGPGDWEPRTRKTKTLEATNETSYQPKILNAPDRLARLRGHEATMAHADAVRSEHQSSRCDLLLPVLHALKTRGIYTADGVAAQRVPTIENLKAYVNGEGDDRILAFRKYRNVHGLQGGVVHYHVYFDFVHGGAERHVTVTDGIPRPFIIADKSAVQKDPKQKRASVVYKSVERL